jgi:hypothetical protein
VLLGLLPGGVAIDVQQAVTAVLEAAHWTHAVRALP